jgi:predicted transcriptional regulator/predicted RNA-binding Zn-ribbon protein involved in translation (DUF1610 family)
MGKPVINAQEALELIKAGVNDAELMAKYNLSPKGLQSLFDKLLSAGVLAQDELDLRCSDTGGFITVSQELEILAQRGTKGLTLERSAPQTIKAVEVIRDVRAGVSDTLLMERFHLNARGLQSVFDQLSALGLIKPEELAFRSRHKDETVDLTDIIRQLGMDSSALRKEKDTRIPDRCIACGAPQTVEFEECPACGVNIREYKIKLKESVAKKYAVWTCPACGRPQNQEYDECPVCGVIVSKLKTT